MRISALLLSFRNIRLVDHLILTRVTQSTRPFARRIPSKTQPPQNCRNSLQNRALFRVREILDPPRVFGFIPNNEHAHLTDKKGFNSISRVILLFK
jgi:hypothetical protein